MTTAYSKLRFPKPFSAEKLADFLAISDELDRDIKFPYGERIAERDFWRAAFLRAFDSGLPWRFLFNLPWRAIEPDGRFIIECRLSKEAMFAVGRIRVDGAAASVRAARRWEL